MTEDKVQYYGNPALKAILDAGARQRAIVEEILMERMRQDDKWGEQNHDPFAWIAILLEEVGEVSRGALEAHFGKQSWSGYREELIQVAAVALAMAECYDRNAQP